MKEDQGQCMGVGSLNFERVHRRRSYLKRVRISSPPSVSNLGRITGYNFGCNLTIIPTGIIYAEFY